MKKITVLLLMLVMLLGLTACDELAFKTSDFKVIATPDENGNVIKEDYYTWVGDDFRGEYELRSTIEFDRDEQGNVKEKRIYRLFQGELSLRQRNEYTYNADGKKQQVRLYDAENVHFCTGEYTYDASGAIASKKATFANLVLNTHISLSEGEDGEWIETHYADYSLPDYLYVYEDATANWELHRPMMQTVEGTFITGHTGVSWLYNDTIEYEEGNEPTPDTSLTYTKLVEYYPNGTEKQICEYKNDVLRSKTEYPYRENFEEYIIDGEIGFVDSLIRIDGTLIYSAGEDGTYSTTGWYGTKTYAYYESGELKSQEIHDEKGAGSAESYYPGGKLEGKTEYTFTEDGKGKIKSENYYENGVLSFSSEAIYTAESFRGQYASYYGERYDENGAKTADFRYDPEKSVIVTTKYDEEGNVTERTEEKYSSGMLNVPVVTE